MGVMMGRLYFLAFAGLAVAVVYNALYLQEEKRAASGQRDEAAQIALGEKGRGAPGSASEIMQAIQRELAARGYDPGPADGLAGEKTRKAILEYERNNGLKQTGTPSMDLLRKIVLGDSIGEFGELEPEPAPQPAPSRAAEARPEPAAKPKAAAPAPSVPLPQAKPTVDPTIENVQRVLADLGYAPGPVDGVMGEATRKAIAAFERDRNLPQKGEITPFLLKEIERVTGRQVSGQG